jgi:hypothetical protein
VWNPATPGYEQLHVDQEGQFYTGRWKMPVQIWSQYRGQIDPDIEKPYGHIYPLLLFPIDATNGELLDPQIYPKHKEPLVEVNAGPLGARLYKIAQLEIRWMGFANEHFAAALIPIRMEDDPRAGGGGGGAPAGELEMLGVTDGTCGDCEVMNAGFSLLPDGDSSVSSETFTFSCAPSGSAKWTLFRATGLVVAILIDVPSSGELARYEVSDSGWDEVSNLVIDFVSGDAICNWPATITYNPA